MCGAGLKNTQYLTAQDPYVKVFMQPGPMGEDKTRALPGGGIAPQWEDIDNNRLQLDLKEGATHIEIEVWNANLLSDDLIGKASTGESEVFQVNADDSAISAISTMATPSPRRPKVIVWLTTNLTRLPGKIWCPLTLSDLALYAVTRLPVRWQLGQLDR